MKRNCCTEHIRADAIQKKGHEGYWRFCFQCGKLEPLSEFDGTKRSCRARLQKRKVLAPKRRSTWAASKFRTTSSDASPVSHTAAPAAAGEPEPEETSVTLTRGGQQQQQLHHSDLQVLPDVYSSCTDSCSLAASRMAGRHGCPAPDEYTMALPYATMATPATPVVMTSSIQPAQFSAALPVQQMLRTAAEKCRPQAQAGAGVGQRRRAVLPRAASAHQLGAYSRGQQHVTHNDTCPGSAGLSGLEADFTRLPDASTASAVLWAPPQLASAELQDVGGAAHAALGPQDLAASSGCNDEEYDAMFDDLALFFERELETAAAQAYLSYGKSAEERLTSQPSSGGNMSCPGKPQYVLLFKYAD
eukprot:gene5803-6043_t